MIGTHIKVGHRKVLMHKSIRHWHFDANSVLSNDPWLFVELWLKREKKLEALSYWLQARRFLDAVPHTSVEAKPPLIYYSFLNAVKTLLLVRSTSYNEYHGMSGNRDQDAKASLSNEKIKFKRGGVLPSLLLYLGDGDSSNEYDLKNLLWNLPFIHRAFCHTYRSSADLFIQLEEAGYVIGDNDSFGWFQARVVDRYLDRRSLIKGIPDSFEILGEEMPEKIFIRRSKEFLWIPGKPKKRYMESALYRLFKYHSTIRRLVVTISGQQDLWYLKKSVSNNPASKLHGLTIIFAAMHRLSELSRYHPKNLDKYLCQKENWLLTEFIDHAPNQFIDQIASEITGLNFRKPGIRSL